MVTTFTTGMKRFLFTARQHRILNFIILFLLTYITTIPVQLKWSFHSSIYGTTLDQRSWFRDKENVFLWNQQLKDVFLTRMCLCAMCLRQAMTHVQSFVWTVYVRVFMTKEEVPKDILWLFVCPCLSTGSRVCLERFSLPDTMKNAAEESLMSSLPHPNFNIHVWYITAS